MMTLVGRKMLKQHSCGKVSVIFGPLQSNGKQISRPVFGDVFRKARRLVFGVRNISVDAMRTAQDTLVVEHGQELGLPKENYACTLLRSTITTRPLVSADIKKLMSRVRIPR